MPLQVLMDNNTKKLWQHISLIIKFKITYKDIVLGKSMNSWNTRRAFITEDNLIWYFCYYIYMYKIKCKIIAKTSIPICVNLSLESYITAN